MIKQMVIALAIALGVIAFPVLPVSSVITEENEEREWSEFHADSYAEHADAFTALFNSYETKWSKNNRLMMRAGNEGSFKFVARAK